MNCFLSYLADLIKVGSPSFPGSYLICPVRQHRRNYGGQMHTVAYQGYPKQYQICYMLTWHQFPHTIRDQKPVNTILHGNVVLLESIHINPMLGRVEYDNRTLTTLHLKENHDACYIKIYLNPENKLQKHSEPHIETIIKGNTK